MFHLARHPNGVETFARFLRSYEEHPAGIEHRLVVGVKGYPGPDVPPEYAERLAPLEGQVLALDDVGFDLGSYWAAGRELEYDAFCFLNSFSVILASGWLAKLVDHYGEDVGLVGATGSWESHFSHAAHRLRTVLTLAPSAIAPPPFPPRPLTARDRLWVVRETAGYLGHVPPFPNPHLRTNAFLIRRELMLSLDVGDPASKRDAFLLESGRRSLTRQVVHRGLRVLVVGRDGLAYRPEDWPESGTFRARSQCNLLVSDNRTEEWAAAGPEDRRRAAEATWGPGRTELD